MAQSIWSYHRLDQTCFAAAALTLSRIDTNQSTATSRRTAEDADDTGSDIETVAPRNLVRSYGREKLQQKFLNRLAEIFARQKTFPGRKPNHRASVRSDADHVTAAMLTCGDKKMRVDIAKNTGFDPEDSRILQRLQTWLRSLALTGERRSAQKDSLLAELVQYNSLRLRYYIAKLATSPASRDTDHEAAELLELCRAYHRGQNCSEQELVKIVQAAHRIRYTFCRRNKNSVGRNAAFLGRVQCAWEAMQEFAMHFTECVQIELRPLPRVDPITLTRSDMRQAVDRMPAEIRMNLSEQIKAERWKKLDLYTHAEIQLLLLYCKRNERDMEVFRYIGSSKKTCWLCEELLGRHGYFHTRGSHGAVSAQWTVNCANALGPRDSLKLTEVLYLIQDDMFAKIRGPVARRRLPQSQSTAGVTASTSVATLERFNKKCQLQRHHTDANPTQLSSQPLLLEPIYGPLLGNITAVRLPADAASSCFLNMQLYEKQPGARGTGIGDTVVDFSDYWGISQDECKWLTFEVLANANPANDGQYFAFYMLREDLPLNKYALSVLNLEEASVINSWKPFWRGDMFIFKRQTAGPADASGQDYLSSVPADAKVDEPLVRWLKYVWHENDLDQLLREDQESQIWDANHSAQREIIRARLYSNPSFALVYLCPALTSSRTPVERDIMHHMPLPFESALEDLAITECDDGAIRNVQVRPDPNDASQVIVTSDTRRRELEAIGWQGFRSSDL